MRERGEDILLIAKHLLQLHTQDNKNGPQEFSPAAGKKLLAYAWPGNVRELENVIAQTALYSRGPVITEEDLTLPASSAPAASASPPPNVEAALNTTLEELFAQHAGNVLARSEQLVVGKALALSRYNQVQAARLLGVSRNVLRERMKRYDLL